MTSNKDLEEFSTHCRETYGLLADIVESDVLVRKIIKDAIDGSKVDLVSLFLGYDYSLLEDQVKKDLGDYQYSVYHKIEFKRNLHKKYLRKSTSDSIDFEEMRRAMVGSRESKGNQAEIAQEKSLKYTRKRLNSKGFKPNFLDKLTVMETYNLGTSEQFYNMRIKKLIFKEEELSFGELSICKEYFRNYVLSDEQRKKLWKFKIGNKLNITKKVFQGLLTRLQTGEFCKVTDQQIQADLDRTFPDCKTFKEGREMYGKMHLILLLFHIYRPDVGYVQGMNDLLIIIFYYYDVYETFVLFSNLILTNGILFNMFTFDLDKVTASCLTPP